MRTRLFSLILALFAVLLPQATWADDQGYVELKVNNEAAFDDEDATYSLTFKYGIKPVDDTEGEKVKYFNLTDYHNSRPDWLGYSNERYLEKLNDYRIAHNNPEAHLVITEENLSYIYAYGPRITTASFTADFCSNVQIATTAWWFASCFQLTEITGIENINVSQVEDFADMFYFCLRLEELNINKWETNNAKSFYQLFYNCRSLSQLNARKLNTSNVTSIQGIFFGCNSLLELDLSQWSTAKITDMRSVFSNLNWLKVLDISNFDTRNVTNAVTMFSGCSQLQTIYVGENWTLNNVSRTKTYTENGSTRTRYKGIFDGCVSLIGGAGTTYNQLIEAQKEELKISGTNAALYGQSNAVANIEYARIDEGPDSEHPGLLTGTKVFVVIHNDGTGQKTLYLCNKGVNEVKDEEFKPASFGDEDAALTSGLTVIDNLPRTYSWNIDGALEAVGINKNEITKVVIEPSFKTQRPTTCESWFSGMSNATFEGLENLNTTECTSMKDMFRGTSISSLDFSTDDLKLTFKTSKVTDMSGMFADCTSLTTLDLSSSNFSTANVTTMKDMFSGCSNLKYTTYTDANDNTPFNIDMFNTLKVTDMSGMFRGCAALTGLFNLNRLATENVTDMSEMFQNCTGLTTLQLGGANTKSVTAADRMFQGCSNLETIKVNLIWDMQKGQSTAGMFDGCNKLTGQNGSKYITYLSSDPSNAATGKYAVIDDDATPGYLTEMVPVVLDLYADGDNEAQIQSYGATGQKINSVRVHRTFTAGQWTTLCLPFDMTAAQVTNIFGISSGDLLTLSRYNRTSHAVTYTAATEIKAGVPYLIKPSRVPTFKDDDNNTQYGFAVPNRTISAQTSNVNSNGLILKANYSSATITPGTSEELYTLKAGQSTLGTDLSSTAAYITPEENHVGGLSAYFMLYTADYVTVTMRNSTLDIFSCNYDLDFTDSHLKAWIASAFTPEGNGGKVVLTRITDVPAGTGVVITTTDANSLTDNVPIGTSNIIVRNLLVGTPDGANFTPQMNGNTIYVVSKSTGSIGNPTRGGTMGAGLGWLAIPTDEVEKLKAANGGLANIRFVFEGEDSEATGIEIVEEDAAKADGIYYNLNGQRVTAPAKGIYIKDGKKVYVK